MADKTMDQIVSSVKQHFVFALLSENTLKNSIGPVWKEFNINQIREDSNLQPLPIKTDRDHRLLICARLLEQKKFIKYSAD